YNHVDTLENMRAANRVLEPQFPKQIHDDTLEVLSKLTLHGIVAGVVTSTNTEFAVADLTRLQVPQDAFLFVQGAEVTSHHKPDGRVFNPALLRLEGLGIKRSEVLYVGDALMDYQAAIDASIQFVGVATGFVSFEQFKEVGAAAISRLGDLPAYIGVTR
ncbi:MAG TPA: HAD hydrolase-like protein, partial [Ktedonobacterales bacterium]